MCARVHDVQYMSEESQSTRPGEVQIGRCIGGPHQPLGGSTMLQIRANRFVTPLACRVCPWCLTIPQRGTWDFKLSSIRCDSGAILASFRSECGSRIGSTQDIRAACTKPARGGAAGSLVREIFKQENTVFVIRFGTVSPDRI